MINGPTWSQKLRTEIGQAVIGQDAVIERMPYPGPLGQRIFDAVSQEAWAGWARHQTILINE